MRLAELEKMYQLEDRHWWFVGRRRLVRALLARYAPHNASLLDVGCGTGGTMDALAGLGEIWGADVSESALAFCRLRGHTRLVRCQAQALAFRSDAFDAAVCCDVLEHVEDDIAALAEVLRVLRPGAVIVISVPAFRWLWSQHDEALSHLRRYDRQELVAKIDAAGGRVVRISFAVTFVFPAVALVRLTQRLLRLPRGEAHTQVGRVAPWLNRLLTALMDLEVWLVQRANLPFGSSLVAVVVKEGGSVGAAMA